MYINHPCCCLLKRAETLTSLRKLVPEAWTGSCSRLCNEMSALRTIRYLVLTFPGATPLHRGSGGDGSDKQAVSGSRTAGLPCDLRTCGFITCRLTGVDCISRGLWHSCAGAGIASIIRGISFCKALMPARMRGGPCRTPARCGLDSERGRRWRQVLSYLLVLLRRSSFSTASVMDCLVEGVPTYGLNLRL